MVIRVGDIRLTWRRAETKPFTSGGILRLGATGPSNHDLRGAHTSPMHRWPLSSASTGRTATTRPCPCKRPTVVVVLRAPATDDSKHSMLMRKLVSTRGHGAEAADDPRVVTHEQRA
jgi:hypothetical protein